MADEAVLVLETQIPIPFTIADGTGLEQGSVMVLSDPRTASANTYSGSLVAGILAVEKIANDGVTQAGVYRAGIFKVKCSGSVGVGDPLGTADVNHPNRVVSFLNNGTLSGSRYLGVALETGTDGETILMELRPSFGAGA